MAVSNYRPSKAWYPLEEYFDDVPDDIIQCPNAEHWRFKWDGVLTNNSNIHLNGVGSTYQSDTADVYGSGKEIFEEIPEILARLIYSDGGGITINHPNWSNWYLDRKSLPIDRIFALLDADERVLGIEFYNQSSEDSPASKDDQGNGHGWDLDTWDSVLITGRRAWGFAVPDHWHERNSEWNGRNVLLVPEKTSHACLKAYRNGEFFTKLKNTPLSFTNISIIDKTLTIATNSATTIAVILDKERTEYSGSSTIVDLPNSFTYIRVEATDGDNTIYSNPIMGRDRIRRRNNFVKKTLMM